MNSNSSNLTQFHFRGGVILAPDQSPFSALEPELTHGNGNGTNFDATGEEDEVRPSVEKDKYIFEVPDDVFHPNFTYSLWCKMQTNAT